MNNKRLAFLVMATMLASGCSLLPERGTNKQVWHPAEPVAMPDEIRTPGAIFSLNTQRELFSDVKARRIGDIITIRLVEKTAARKSSSTSTSKDTSINNQNPKLFGVDLRSGGNPILAQTIDGSQSFDGDGASSQSNELQGSITVTVAQRLPNGNLYVRGEKWLTLNQGEEFVRISGIVRPFDVGPDNAVPSSKVADARIVYSGKGPLADANRQGWLARFFSRPLMPF
ncbi:MAG: flagellar basal body L-ring protein FlgH [Gammaproteobacteria bacterium]|nr:flagellar basal body L-ring protein FlgH [Gammaproteobacteria bacterium]NNF61199.1 flagellar basal body L-ring protein FlgH [Gammaproteobacteria bacterium]NNM19948.1 flagellar basal body L-ring protein FlgH [Gammaproteobacteria bacterium]